MRVRTCRWSRHENSYTPASSNRQRLWRDSIILRLVAIYLLGSCLAACDIRTLYGVELADTSNNTVWQSIQKDGYTLFLTGSNHDEVPGFYLIAQTNDQPDPPWNWEEFQTRSAEEKALTYGQYFDSIFLNINVRHQSKCPYQAISFDHRDSAQEQAYGRWLHQQPMRDRLNGPTKGLYVQIPVSDCTFLLNQPGTKLEALTVVVASERAEDDDEIEIRFRVVVVDTWLDTKFFGRWFSSL